MAWLGWLLAGRKVNPDVAHRGRENSLGVAAAKRRTEEGKREREEKSERREERVALAADCIYTPSRRAELCTVEHPPARRYFAVQIISIPSRTNTRERKRDGEREGERKGLRRPLARG